MTGVGMILGTAAYMSPEQAKGRTVDKRSDVWAFGAVLYEMLTGRRAFEGEDVSDTLARVLMKEPDWTALPATMPACGGDRCCGAACRRTASSARATSATCPWRSRARSRPPARRRRRRPVMSIAGTTGLDGRGRRCVGDDRARRARASASARNPPPVPLEARTDIVTPATDYPISLALSPDGRQIVFVASGDGASRLWLRSLADGSTRVLAGTENARTPFWSADNRSIGFIVRGSLTRIDLSDGSVRTLSERSGLGRGGTWNGDGVIVYATTGPLARLDVASTGPPVDGTKLGAQETGHVQPQFLPDGRRFIYYANGAPGVRGIYLGSLDGDTPRRLVTADAGGVLAKGHLVFPRQGALVAQSFDLERFEAVGEAFRIAEPPGDSAGTTGVSWGYRRLRPVRSRFDRWPHLANNWSGSTGRAPKSDASTIRAMSSILNSLPTDAG